MISAKVYAISVFRGTGKDPTRSKFGVVVSEDDDSLPYQRVKVSVDWGDGTEPYLIAAQESPINIPSTPTILRQSSVVSLGFDEVPYTGTYELIWNGNSISGIAFDSSAREIQSLLRETGASVDVTGSFPKWTISFDTVQNASYLTIGASLLKAPYPLPVHLYATGTFVLKVTASNLRSPRPDTSQSQVVLDYTEAPKGSSRAPVLIGPVLASDIGFPNSQQWNFDTASDLKVLSSSVKMILIVEPGERRMMPEYGAALRQFLFDPLVSATERDVNAEIRRAIDTWEPRVRVLDIKTTRQVRSIEVALTLVSRLNQERFQLNVELER